MIYEIAGTSDSINQGDIISQCPLIYWLMERRSDGILERRATVSHERVVVLTQSCDLANDKTHGSALRSDIFQDRVTGALRDPGRSRVGNTNLH